MQIPTRFSIAVHICLCLEFFDADSETNHDCDKVHCKKMTSEVLADSVGVNSVIVRNILAQLKMANIVSVSRGSGGGKLAKNPQKISLLDIFNAVDSMGEDGLFRFHTNSSKLCPLGKNIHFLLDTHFEQAQKALESYLENIKLIDLLKILQNSNKRFA